MRHLGINVLDGVSENKINLDVIPQSDIIVIQRDFPRDLDTYEKLIKQARSDQKPVIFDIDDLLILFPQDHPERYVEKYIEALLPMLQILHEADLVTTTTPFMQNWLKQFNNHINLLPNFFDDELWQLRKPVIKKANQSPLIIGYMGSESHLPDLEFISPVLIKLINRFPKRLQFHFWGVKPPEIIASYPQVKWIPAVSYEYIDFAAYFQTQYADIFIAPLAESPFNQAKSPLKFFEYTALGTPGVYSNLDTFTQAVTHNHDGLLASSLDEWQENLVMLIQDPELRQSLAENAQQTIRDHWLLSKNAFSWQQVYKDVFKLDDSQRDFNYQNYAVIKSITQQYYYLNNSRKTKIAKQDLTIKEKEYQIVAQKTELSTLKNRIIALSEELSTMKNSWGWKMVLVIRKVRDKLVPAGTRRAALLNSMLQKIKDRQSKTISNRGEQLSYIDLDTDTWLVDCQETTPHTDSIDIIVCVHNALEDVKNCLDSIEAQTNQPYDLIIVDDGSSVTTKEYLENYSSTHENIQLIRNEKALGYTKAANKGMKASNAPFLVLLNSDTIVTPNWIDRLFRAMTKNENIGVVGPLSNTASWQSIPELSENGDWAINDLPEAISVNDMGEFIAKHSACIHPEVPLLNGFCLMIRKEVIEKIGYFDEDNFGQGYGEEDDFIVRATKSGWKAVIADDAYIFHAQSKSYTNSTRFKLQKQSGKNLINKHGADHIAERVAFMNPNRVMEGIRARARIMLEREECLDQGRERFRDKSLLFVLPVLDAGGGANVILDEARYMTEMGVKVSIFNLSTNKSGFLRNYAHINLPYIFGKPQDLSDLVKSFDAVVASANYSIPWFKPLQKLKNKPILGYYIQGFEPLMYSTGSDEYLQALESYTAIEGMKNFTKTQWTKQTVLENTGADSQVIGISANIDLFRPRNMVSLGLTPITIVAMIRPASPYRNPEMTVMILEEIKKKFNKDVVIWLFGADNVQEVVDQRFLDFEWHNLGKLTQVQVASMMSKADIFTDFSSHQAMGLSSLEAMSAGSAVIVPQNGGATEFVKHKYNGIVADTVDFDASVNTLEELISDSQLRKQIQINAINDVVRYYPEKASYNILKVLFSD